MLFNKKENALNNSIRRVRPERTGVRAPLGDLEQAVMRHIWNCGLTGCQGIDIQRELDGERPIAVTTVLTTLDRLLNKGIVRREREGKAYRYWALLSEDQLQQRIVEGVMGNLIANFPKAVATYFAQKGVADPGLATAEDDMLANLSKRVGNLRAEHPQEEAGAA
jgi:predicted transcriptional regulator